MMIRKIRKHLLITGTRLNQKKELKQIANYKNNALNKVIASLLKVKNSDYSDKDRQVFANCEKYRTHLLRDETLISYEIFGSNKTAPVKDICKNAASGRKWCEFLYFLVKITSPSVTLEIGTNLGISGCYVLEGIKDNKDAKFITMEGLSQLCEISAKQFATIAPASHYDIREGLFDSTFPVLLKEDIRFNLIFIDGNHRKEPTIAYFNSLKAKISSPSTFIFDDINWSAEMKEAWEVIKNDKDVTFAIDLYKQGVVIIDDQASAKKVDFKFHLAY